MSLSFHSSTQPPPKSDLMIPIYDSDRTTDDSYSHKFINTQTPSLPHSSTSGHFWERPGVSIYNGEHRLFGVVPTMRLVNTMCVVYALWTGVDFIVGLCTLAMEFTCAFALAFTIAYWMWATWWVCVCVWVSVCEWVSECEWGSEGGSECVCVSLGVSVSVCAWGVLRHFTYDWKSNCW